MDSIKYRYYIKLVNQMHAEGFSPSQMQREIPVRVNTLKTWHDQLSLKINSFNETVHTNYNHKRTLTKEEFSSVYDESLTDLEMSVKAKVSRRQFSKLKLLYGYNKVVNKVKVQNKEVICLKDYSEQALLGIMLGDGHLRKGVNRNTHGTMAHSIKQRDYLLHKYDLFKDISTGIKYYNAICSNNGRRYKACKFYLLSNPYLNKFYDNLYINNKRELTQWYIDKYTYISLAYHFMDDGSKSKNGYVLHTYAFAIKDINSFRSMLKKRFSLKTTLRKDNTVYIKKESVNIFNKHVVKYIHKSMLYKLH
jgi:hypothetical protein